MSVRDHEPVIIETFNGLWDRGDDESCPLDHFTVANNVQYVESGIETRDPLTRWQTSGPPPLTKILRIYNYVMQTGQSLLVMVEGGAIYHLVGPNTQYGPIATFPEATDFGFISIAGRAYITPFKSYLDDTNQAYELGLPGESVWVYQGKGDPARKTGGLAPTNGGITNLIAFNDTQEGGVTKGFHLITVVYYPSGAYHPTLVLAVDAPGNAKIQLLNIPQGPPNTTHKTVAMTTSIPAQYVGITYYQYYRALEIADMTITAAKVDIDDAALVAAGIAGWGSTFFTEGMQMASTLGEGHAELGFHIVGVVYETDTGYLTAPGPEWFATNTFVSVTNSVVVGSIPRSPDPNVKKRHLISTKAIQDYNGDQRGYQFFFIPGGTIENNTDLTKIVSYYDSDLIEDASHLLDNYDTIPAGVNLSMYHSRMVVTGISTSPDLVAAPHTMSRPDNRSVALLSAPGEPEAISKVDGLIITPLDGSPLTNAQEFRDILYLFKKTRTYSYSDNFDVPSSWQEQVLDQGIGAPVHGIATVLDSGGVNTDYLLIVDWSGVILFNGTYSRPELTFKIEDFWFAQDRNGFHLIQIANDSISKRLYICLPSPYRHFILYADYRNGLDAKNIRWAKWIFDARINSVCLIETSKLVMGATTT
jgi:hypothetical protein